MVTDNPNMVVTLLGEPCSTTYSKKQFNLQHSTYTSGNFHKPNPVHTPSISFLVSEVARLTAPTNDPPTFHFIPLFQLCYPHFLSFDQPQHTSSCSPTNVYAMCMSFTHHSHLIICTSAVCFIIISDPHQCITSSEACAFPQP